MQKVKETYPVENSLQLSKRDFRRLLGISIFQKRERLHSKALLMKIHSAWNQSSLPFFWFGDAWFADKLSPEQTLYCFPSGRIQIDQTDTFIKAMARHCLDEMLAVQTEGPYLMGGFCFDAWVAYEVAQLLHERGHKTALLIMIECYTLDEKEQRFNGYANHVKKLFSGSFQSRLDYLRLIVPWGNKDQNGPNYDIPLEEMSVADQVNLLTKYAMEEYDRQPTAQPVELIFGSDSWHSNYYKLGRFVPRLNAGWFKTVHGAMTSRFIPGNHDTILEEPNVELMAKLVQSCVDQARFELD